MLRLADCLNYTGLGLSCLTLALAGAFLPDVRAGGLGGAFLCLTALSQILCILSFSTAAVSQKPRGEYRGAMALSSLAETLAQLLACCSFLCKLGASSGQATGLPASQLLHLLAAFLAVGGNAMYSLFSDVTFRSFLIKAGPGALAATHLFYHLAGRLSALGVDPAGSLDAGQQRQMEVLTLTEVLCGILLGLSSVFCLEPVGLACLAHASLSWNPAFVSRHRALSAGLGAAGAGGALCVAGLLASAGVVQARDKGAAIKQKQMHAVMNAFATVN